MLTKNVKTNVRSAKKIGIVFNVIMRLFIRKSPYLFYLQFCIIAEYKNTKPIIHASPKNKCNLIRFPILCQVERRKTFENIDLEGDLRRKQSIAIIIS